MKIQPIQTQPTFQSKIKAEKWKTFDGYISHNKNILLDNGKELQVMTEYKNGQKETCLQCLFDEAGNWVKSKLRYFKGNKVSRIVRGEARKEDIL